VDLSKDEMLEIVRSHAAFEYASDLDATMSTVSERPLWEFHPLGIRVEGRDAVARAYELQFVHNLPFVESSTQRTVFFGEASFAREAEYKIRLPSGVRTVGHALIAFTFEEGLVSSERAYVSGGFVKLLENTFDEEFLAIPGVSRLDAFYPQP
jgi:hypothetical protein